MMQEGCCSKVTQIFLTLGASRHRRDGKGSHNIDEINASPKKDLTFQRFIIRRSWGFYFVT